MLLDVGRHHEGRPSNPRWTRRRELGFNFVKTPSEPRFGLVRNGLFHSVCAESTPCHLAHSPLPLLIWAVSLALYVFSGSPG